MGSDTDISNSKLGDYGKYTSCQLAGNFNNTKSSVDANK